MIKKSVKTKRRILKSAKDLFSAKGFDGTSVQEISKKAKVNKALIYYYFKSKNEILDTLFNSFIENEIENVYQFVKKYKFTIEGHSEFIKNMYSYIKKNKKILRVIFMQSLSIEEGFDVIELWKNIVKEINKKIIHLNYKLKDDSVSLHNEYCLGVMPLLTFTLLPDSENNIEYLEYYIAKSYKVLKDSVIEVNKDDY